MALALKRFYEYKLENLTDNEDALALLGRLLKDRAITLNGVERSEALLKSANAYNGAWQLTQGIYSGINAATLFVLAGQSDTGKNIAMKVLDVTKKKNPNSSRERRYYWNATTAEALLLIHKDDKARSVLKQAVSADPTNYVARATTLRQFERILKHQGSDPSWLDEFRLPLTCFYAGSIRNIEPDEKIEKQLVQVINAFLDKHQVGAAFGALAAGSDIIFAEAAIKRGITLNIVLPCSRVTFEEQSVAKFGSEWVARYQHCLSGATKVSEAFSTGTLLDEVSINLAAQLAMGQSIKHARSLASKATQVIIQPHTDSLSSEFSDLWNETHPELESITLAARHPVTHRRKVPRTPPVNSNRKLVSMLFADLTGFGRLNDKEVVSVLRHILTPLSSTLNKAGSQLTHLDSWGDGLFAVFNDVVLAARTALALQEEMLKVDLAKVGLPETISLRIGIHCGPAMYATDPVTKRPGVFGAEVSYAAGIEPMAVPGAILASEVFASILLLHSTDTFACTYAGRCQLKGMTTPSRLYSVTESCPKDVPVPALSNFADTGPKDASSPIG